MSKCKPQKKTEPTKTFFRQLKSLNEDAEISDGEFRFAFTLVDAANDVHGLAWYNYPDWCDMAHQTKPTIIKYIRKFEKIGLVETYKVFARGRLPSKKKAKRDTVVIYPTEKLCTLKNRKPFDVLLRELEMIPYTEADTGKTNLPEQRDGYRESGKTDLPERDNKNNDTGKADLPVPVNSITSSGKIGEPPLRDNYKITATDPGAAAPIKGAGCSRGDDPDNSAEYDKVNSSDKKADPDFGGSTLECAARAREMVFALGKKK